MDQDLNPTQRFSNRVENYIKFRPGYPAEIFELLKTECGLTPASVIADIGSGTGILSEMFLQNGNVVYGVEPNADMRAAGERLLAKYDKFHSVNGHAEETTLQARSVNLVTAAQAFHWFDPQKTRREFQRILKPEAWVALIWNDRETDTTPFLRAYEDLLLRYSLDYEKINHKNTDEKAIGRFFSPKSFSTGTVANVQHLDFSGLKGRLLSSSYIPAEGHAKYPPMIDDLLVLFDQYQENGQVIIEYVTRVYYGKLR
jgi:ubiquinone/menaquinone biosynthesis C-methylase UbiE